MYLPYLVKTTEFYLACCCYRKSNKVREFAKQAYSLAEKVETTFVSSRFSDKQKVSMLSNF